jgi:hypothetical protein
MILPVTTGRLKLVLLVLLYLLALGLAAVERRAPEKPPADTRNVT